MKRTVKVPSNIPILSVGIFWLLYALLFPLHKAWHFVICLLGSAACYAVMCLIFRPRMLEISEPEKTGDEEADGIIARGYSYLKAIENANRDIGDTDVSLSLDKMHFTLQNILNAADTPERAKRLRRFMDYYLPSAVKLAEEYARLESFGGDGTNTLLVKTNIANGMEKVNEAFLKELDNMSAADALDISADIEVLQKVMAANGLIENADTINITATRQKEI